MVRLLLTQQPQHGFSVVPTDLYQFIHQLCFSLVTQCLVTATGRIQ